MVIYSIPATPQNDAAMRTRAIEKYGEPDHKTGDWIYKWCPHPTILGCPLNEASLTYASSKIEMSDPIFSGKVIKWIRSQKTTTPLF